MAKFVEGEGVPRDVCVCVCRRKCVWRRMAGSELLEKISKEKGRILKGLMESIDVQSSHRNNTKSLGA